MPADPEGETTLPAVSVEEIEDAVVDGDSPISTGTAVAALRHRTFRIVFLGAWVLGDLGVINFPTFYNGKYAYPIDQAVPQVKLIYGSPVALAIYAWLGPICEVAILSMLSMSVIHAKVYASPPAA